MKLDFPLLTLLSIALLVTACASSDPTVKDFKMMQAVYKNQALKDQQTISDLRRDFDAAQRELNTSMAARAALDGKLSEALRRVEQQRDELTRAKDERAQLASQQTTQIAANMSQLTEEHARAREDRIQFAKTMKLLSEHMVELEGLKQALTEAGRDPRFQSVEAALNKQNEALAGLQASIEKVQGSLAEVQRQAQERPQPQVPATLPARKRKQTAVPKDIPPAPKDGPAGGPARR
jgi:chromosome segregation ATPase